MRNRTRLFPLISLISLISLTTLPWALACDPGTPGEGEGEGEPAGEGEGEGDGPLVIDYQFEDATGAAIADDLLVLPEHDAANGPLDVVLGLRNLGAADFQILSDPPLLVAGRDGAFFAVVAQPDTIVSAQNAVSFTLRYAPQAGGEHEGKLLFAYGVLQEERVLLTVEATAAGPVEVPGVRFSAFDGTFDLLPDFSTLGAVETGVSPTFDISARVDGDNFAYLFEGNIAVDTDGDYTFFTTSDDGSRLFIDGAQIVDNDGLHGAVEQSGVTTLAAGPHAIRVEFFEKAGAAALLVEWQGPGVAREEIPAARLSTN